jgi:FkbM family methyltransferase
VVLDIGAHIGTFSLLAAEKASRGRVFAIEASRETFELLRLNIALSGHRNIVAEHLAMADRDGVIELHHDPDGNYGHSITHNARGTSESVPATTLTRYLNQNGLHDVSLVKFNCEGAEFPILLSTPAAVLQRIEKMIVLYHCDLVDAQAVTLIQHLRDSRFDTRVLNETASRGWIIATRR